MRKLDPEEQLNYERRERREKKSDLMIDCFRVFRVFRSDLNSRMQVKG